MSTYITVEDVTTRLSNEIRPILQLADDVDLPTVHADPKLIAAVTDTNGIVDSYLGQAYELPITTIPQAVVPYAVSIVRWLLLVDRHDMATEMDKTKYDEAIAFFQAIVDGNASLGLPEGSLPEISGQPSLTNIASALDPYEDDWSSATDGLGSKEAFARW